MRRIVITGMGMVSPLGNNLASSWEALLQGKSGIQLYENDAVLKNASPYNLAIIKNFDFKKWKVPHANNRMNNFLASAAEQALNMSKVDFQQIDKKRFGICIGSMSSNISKINEFVDQSKSENFKNINRLSMLHILSNIPAGMLNVKYQTKGPSLTVSTACASGLSSVVEAYKWIKLNEADIAIAGGVEDVYNPICLNSSLRLQAMTAKIYNNPSESSCPFDKSRSGFVLGEGSAALILESQEHAKKRGAEIIGQVLGYGYTSDGFHLVRPESSGQGQIQAMKKAINMANISESDIDCINTHATSTPAGDQIQANSIKKLFKHNKPYVTASKGSIGHTFGAAGSIELSLTLKSLKQGIIPKIANLKNPDVEDVNYVMGENIRKDMKYCLKNSFGFGGINVSLVIAKYHQ